MLTESFVESDPKRTAWVSGAYATPLLPLRTRLKA
jgi:hypothetical protein